MNYLQSVCAATLAWLLLVDPVAAESVGFKLWITARSAEDAINCPKVAPRTSTSVDVTLSEKDIFRWRNADGEILLKANTLSSESIANHCFVLELDKKVAASGVMTHQAKKPFEGGSRLLVSKFGYLPTLQFTALNALGRSEPILLREIDAVLGNKANMNRQLKRLENYFGRDEFAAKTLLSREWSAAVEDLATKKILDKDAPLEVAMGHLGDPTRCVVDANYRSCSWYFEIGAHINPRLEIFAVDGKITGYEFGRR